MQGIDFFLSYSVADRELAQSFYDKLEAGGRRCYLAERDIKVGEPWQDSIRDALRTAKCVFTIVTPNSVESDWVAAELGAAWALEKRLVVAVQNVDVTKVFPQLRDFQAKSIVTGKQQEALMSELLDEDFFASAGAPIAGSWLVRYARDAAVVAEISFEQSGRDVRGRSLVRRDRKDAEVDRRYEYHGRFVQNSLVLSFEDVKNDGLTGGAMVLYFENEDARTLIGKSIYFKRELNGIDLADVFFERMPGGGD